MEALTGSVKMVMDKNATTNCTQINAEQHLRWHVTIDSILEELKRLNQPWEKFEPVMHHFVGNTDESCLMAANRKITVVTSGFKKNRQDCLLL